MRPLINIPREETRIFFNWATSTPVSSYNPDYKNLLYTYVEKAVGYMRNFVTRSNDNFKKLFTEVRTSLCNSYDHGGYLEYIKAVQNQEHSRFIVYFTDTYIHYEVILANLRKNKELIVSHIPYALTALRDYELISDEQDGDIKSVREWILEANENSYKKLNTESKKKLQQSLFQQYGRYCAYCEIPITSTNPDIEHILPKAQFPALQMYWFNFVPACKICNESFKKNQPKPSQLIGFSKEVDNNQFFTKNNGCKLQYNEHDDKSMEQYVSNLEYLQLADEIYQLPTDENSYKNIDYILYNEGFEINIKHIENYKRLNLNKNEIVFTDKTNNFQLRGNFFIKTNNFKAKNINDLLKLNNINTHDYGDQRVLGRNKASMIAFNKLKLITKLIPMYFNLNSNSKNRSSFYFSILNDFCDTIYSTGFLSVYLKIFSWTHSPIDQSKTISHDIIDCIKENKYFPGTNWPAILHAIENPDGMDVG